MTAQFSNTPPVPLFTPQNGFPFVTWIQVKAKHHGPPPARWGSSRAANARSTRLFCQNPNPNAVMSAGPVRPAVQRPPSPSPSCGNQGQGQGGCNSQARRRRRRRRARRVSGQPLSTPPGLRAASRTSAGGSSSASRGSPTLTAALQPAEEALRLRRRHAAAAVAELRWLSAAAGPCWHAGSLRLAELGSQPADVGGCVWRLADRGGAGGPDDLDEHGRIDLTGLHASVPVAAGAEFVA